MLRTHTWFTFFSDRISYFCCFVGFSLSIYYEFIMCGASFFSCLFHSDESSFDTVFDIQLYFLLLLMLTLFFLSPPCFILFEIAFIITRCLFHNVRMVICKCCSFAHVNNARQIIQFIEWPHTHAIVNVGNITGVKWSCDICFSIVFHIKPSELFNDIRMSFYGMDMANKN